MSNEENEKIINHDHVHVDEEGPSIVKKLDHNAKERIRRMKLGASYLALRMLLPDSSRTKKRWSAPVIVDKVLKYIPELENEIEELKSKKENMKQISAAKNKKIINSSTENPSSHYQNHTISVNLVNQEEAIVQICMSRSEDNNNRENGSSAFTDLLQRLEDDESIIGIKSASSLYICDSRICYHLHIQVNQIYSVADHIEELRNKLISWLR